MNMTIHGARCSVCEAQHLPLLQYLETNGIDSLDSPSHTLKFLCFNCFRFYLGEIR